MKRQYVYLQWYVFNLRVTTFIKIHINSTNMHFTDKQETSHIKIRNKSIVMLLFGLLLSTSMFSQVIYGTVTDKATSEPLAGAALKLMPDDTGTISSEKGHFNFEQLNPGQYTLQCSYLGYQQVEKQINITDKDVVVNFELQRTIRQIDEIIVQGNITGPVKRAGDVLFTGTAITKNGISLMGAGAGNSVYKALDIMPGIAVENNDAYGLSGKTVRIRGIRSTFSGMTIKGFPNYGIMPIGARDDI
jgi:iron complex outermembrane receptor protein